MTRIHCFNFQLL